MAFLTGLASGVSDARRGDLPAAGDGECICDGGAATCGVRGVGGAERIASLLLAITCSSLDDDKRAAAGPVAVPTRLVAT